MLFDTNFFIDLEHELRARKPGPAAAFLKQHRGYQKYVSTITVGEFSVGAVPAAVRRFFRGYQALPLGREDAIFCGRLQARLPFEMGENDLWIAGLALRHKLPLVSRDKVFPQVPGLRVMTY